ncbi:hypothetical protein DM860_013424 [Cuscuta australis]|uniref:Uncharacterized protein n=1 Tax=Cuscuta australis TaxID=267555 RepID=A0A328D495_9ASTE|nr:hypothetical protein DM860_013424 [Cuscuta australis]
MHTTLFIEVEEEMAFVNFQIYRSLPDLNSVSNYRGSTMIWVGWQGMPACGSSVIHWLESGGSPDGLYFGADSWVWADGVLVDCARVWKGSVG